MLAMIGVRQWYSKCVLPNAAVSPKDIFCEIKVAEAASITAAPKMSGVMPLVLPVLESVEGIAKPKIVADIEVYPAESVVKGVKPEVSQHINIVPRLTVSAVSLENITILFEQADSGGDEAEKALLESIVSVIAGRIACVDQKGSTLSWPVFESGVFKDELSVYFDLVVKRWLERQCWSECDYVFYFGDYLSSLETVLLDIRAEQCLEYKVVSCKASLAQILSSPIKKKSLWDLLSHIGVLGG